MRKKKRSMKEAMNLQNNIAVLMGKVQKDILAERRPWVSPLSHNSNNQQQISGSEAMFEIDYDPAKPKTIAISSRNHKFSNA